MVNGMKDAFVYSQAAIDALNSLADTDPTHDPAYIAKLDLLQYLFLNTMKHPPTVDGTDQVFQKVLDVFTQVQRFNHNGDGSYTVRPQGELPSDDVIVYCDYSRFQEGRNCDGSLSSSMACDRDTGLAVDMDADYTGCQAHSLYNGLVCLKYLHVSCV